jgi:fumarate reductase subunit C
MSSISYILRVIHFIISAYFLLCILFIYYSVITNNESKLFYLAVLSVLIEGVVVFLNDKNCPLGILHKRYGDEKTFFELFLPKKMAKQIIPVLGTIAMLGIIAYFIQRLIS